MVLAVVFLFFVALYFAPIFIAGSRQHRQLIPIAVVTLFLGWTLVGWVVALCWSLMMPPAPTPAPAQPAQPFC